MVVDNEEAFRRLKGIVDYLLLHNRRIVNRCDDSVVRVVDGAPNPIRRSRGYVMEPIKLSFKPKGCVVAVGAEENVTGAVLKGDHCYPTQYIGDVDRLGTYDYLSSSLDAFIRLLRVERVDAVACDMHPRFLTRRLAKELAERFNAELVEVQHHHAHAASLMAESGMGIDEELVCITADGVGYGVDGQPWGGEVLLVTGYGEFRRMGRLARLPMPGGDLCARYPARMLMAALSVAWSVEEAERAMVEGYLDGFKHGEVEVRLVARQLMKGGHPHTTSTGRVLDAASAMLRACLERTYEGEPAMKLEALASRGDPSRVRLPVEVRGGDDGCLWLDTPLILAEAFNAYRSGARREDVAAAVEEAIAIGLATMAVEVAERVGVGSVGFSGGVAYNDHITRRVRGYVESHGLRFYRHVKVPSGDGGVSLGQASVAAARLLT